MKYLIIVFLSISLACAHEIHLRDGITPQKFPSIKQGEDVLLKAKWEKLRSVVEDEHYNLGAGGIEADVTDYALDILAYVANYMVHEGLDPMQLSDENLSLFPGTLDLTNGWLQDLSTITVFDEVVVKYTHSTKILELTLPLAFKELLIDYNYHAQVLLLGVTGTIDAKIADLRIDLHMGFNFTEYHAFVDKVDLKDSGAITIKFTGLGLLDWLVEVMTDILVGVFHTLIFSIVDAVIYSPVQDVVNSINSAIDAVLHPNTTNLMIN